MLRLVARPAILASLLFALPAFAQDEAAPDGSAPAETGVATDESAVPEASAADASDAAEAAAATTAAAERAATVQLVPAFLMAYGAGATDNFSAGLQLRLDFHPTDRFPIRTGGYFTGEVYADGTFRFAGGMAGAVWMMGCRVGLAYRTETANFASSLGLELAKSIDFMGFSIGGRMTIPLVDFVSPNGGPQRVQGLEGQVFVTIGWPVGLDGPTRRGCGCPHGHHAPSEAPAAIEEGATEDAPSIDEAPAS
jgi:hypothetical protein